MIVAAVTGVLAGTALGFVLHRGQVCFHSGISDSLDRRFMLTRGWAFGVALASVGLAVLFLLPGTEGLNRGLAFRPIADVAGGLLLGGGMAVAQSCVSGLFYKLGSGMLGALAGLAGWALGELAVRSIHVPGPTLLRAGDAATLPGVLGLPRFLASLVVLAAVAAWLWRHPGADVLDRPWQWGWRRIGAGLGATVTLAWALAAVGGASFGPSSVGAVSGIAIGSPNVWLVAFLLGIVTGGTLGARTAGALWVRGENPVRYLQLASGGLLLGAGGWIAGGCNLGHGLSGVAQLNVSSLVVVASMVAGLAAARRMLRGSVVLVVR